MEFRRHLVHMTLLLMMASLPPMQRACAQNLIPNGGLEEGDTCVQTLGIGGLQHWYSAFLHFDRLQSCAEYGAVNGLPMSTFTFQQPFEGESCIGLFTYYQNGQQEQREWAMVPLLEPLVVGQTYYCSFRANAGFGGNAEYPTIWLGNSHVGMLFTTYDRHWYQGDPYPAPLNTAHVYRPIVLADTVGWTLISGEFVADSAYQYLMVGNFFSNTLTDTLHFADPNSVFPWYPRGYTLIDAVCVSSSPFDCDLGGIVSDHSAQTALLYPNPTSEELMIRGRSGAHALVTDRLGRVVWEGQVTSNHWGLHVESWAKGSYVLRLTLLNAVESWKFMVVD